MKRNLKAEKSLITRNHVMRAIVESGDHKRFRSRTQRSEKSKRKGSRARRKAQQRREDWS